MKYLTTNWRAYAMFLLVIACLTFLGLGNTVLAAAVTHQNDTTPTDSLRAMDAAAFFSYNPYLEYRVDEIFQHLTDTQRVGQLIVPAAGRLGQPDDTLRKYIAKGYIGGILLLNGDKERFKQLVASFNALNLLTNGVPLLYSADAEPSLVNRKIAGTQPVGKTNTITSSAMADSVARVIGNDLLEIGIRHNYAPVTDVGNDNSAIGNRSFGPHPDTVVKYNQAFINATQAMGIVATAKHFPGHGLVKGDTHKKLVYIDGTLTEANNYKPLIANHVLSIMVGHIAVTGHPQYDTDGLPASLSRVVVTNLLKRELGFKGLVVTDALNMGAVSTIPQSALLALQAGCDQVLMPGQVPQLVENTLLEMYTNEAFKAQIYTSVKKVIRLKLFLGLIE